MKLTALKNYFKKAAVLSAAAITVLLASCSGLTDFDAEVQKKENQVYVHVGDVDFARTAKPVYAQDEFTSYKLTWTDADGATKIKQWVPKDGKSAYQVMNNEVFSITAGTYTFVLTASDSKGTVYKGTLSDRTVVNGDTLTFVLDISQLSKTGTGTLSLEITYPYVEGMKREFIRYDAASYGQPGAVGTELLGYSTGISSGWATTTNSWSSIPVGEYKITIMFYADEDKTIPLMSKPWVEYAYITSGKTSYSKVSIDFLDSIYSITYENMDGATVTGAEPLTFTSRMDVTLPAAETVKRTGYTFAGWYDSVDEDGYATGEQVTGWTKYTKTDDVTVYAKWIPNSYNINYYTNIPSDGALSETPFVTQTASHGAKLTAPAEDPTRTGYTFVRWTDSTTNTSFDFENTAVTGNKNLYAVWSYDVAFNANSDDATGEMTAEPFHISWLGSETKALTANAFELEGYSFLGWADADDADEADYADGAAVSFSGAKTLYAVWHDNSTGFVVVFDTNGGTAVASQIVQYGETAAEPAECTKDGGYGFAGWYTNSALTTVYDFTTPVTANIKLYAKWIQNVYYVSADGSDTTGNATRDNPIASIGYALQGINALGSENIDFVIVVSGELKERVSLTSSTLPVSKAKSLTIRGLNGSDTDKLNGNASGTVLTVNTAVPVILANITVTNGYNSVSNTSSRFATAYASGIYIDSGSSLTIKDGTVVSGNQSYANESYSDTAYVSAKSAGGGVYNAGTFIMEGGMITANTAKSKSYNTYRYSNSNAEAVAEGNGSGVYNAGTFIMKGGRISANTIDVQASTNYNYAKRTNRAYGGGVYNYNTATFSMEGGVIEDNTLKTPGSSTYILVYKYGTGIYSGGTFNMSGDARGINCDFYLADGKVVNVTEQLTASTPVATIMRESYSVGTVVVTASDGVTLADEAPKFAVTNTSYRVNEEGKLASRSSYNIYYRDMGGNSLSANSSGFPSTHGTGETTVLPVPSKAGYTFEGWYLTSACDGEPVTALTDENCTSTTYVYAKWTENPYFTVTYKDAGGADYSGSNSSSLTSKHYAGETETLVNAVKSTYLFDAWYLTSDCSDEPVTSLTDANCTANITLYAKWKPHYTITYKDAGGAAFSGSASLTSYRNEGETLTLPAPTKTDCIFAGWYLTSNGSGDAVTVLNDTNASADTTVYAKWTDYYTLTYKDRGGAAFSGTFSSTPRTTYYSGDSSTLSLAIPAKDGYLFLGWFLESDCSGNSLTSLAGLSGNLTLYAWWGVPAIDIQVSSASVSITKNVTEGIVTLTAADGFTDLTWTVDGIEPSERITGAQVSEDGKTLTFSATALHDEHTYFVRVVANNKNGVPCSTNIQITK